jgi:hypothetical protein
MLIISDDDNIEHTPFDYFGTDIKIVRCPALHNIVYYNSLLRLELIDCKNLICIPDFELLQELKCTRINEITSICDFIFLETLYVNNCLNLDDISNLPNLLHCQVIECPNIRNIRNFQRLKTLAAEYNDSLIYFRDLPNIQKLNCVHCISLNEIFVSSDTLEILYLNECPLITNIQNFSLLKCLDIRNMDELVTVNGHLNLRLLNISGCNKLNSIFQLPKLLDCSISECRSIVEFKKFPMLVNLSIDKMDLLVSLEDVFNLRSLIILNCTRCLEANMYCSGCVWKLE